jgi:UPF0716 protein FxsA
MRLALSIIGLSFVAVPALELWVLILLNRRIGLGPTLAMLLVTGLTGFWLAKWQGWRTVQRIQRELAAGQAPSAALMDGVLILVAGLLLITPGFLTDVAGFLLLLPPSRYAVRRVLLWWCRRYLLHHVVVSRGPAGAARGDDGGTVEGRVVSVEDADRRLGEGEGEDGRRG